MPIFYALCSVNTFVRKLDKQFLRNYKSTTSSGVWGPVLLCMRKSSKKTTSGLKFYVRFEFYMPDFLYGGKCLTSDHNIWYFKPIFCCACAERARIPLPIKILTQNLKPPWAVSYSTTNFSGANYKIYVCFEQKWLL